MSHKRGWFRWKVWTLACAVPLGLLAVSLLGLLYGGALTFLAVVLLRVLLRRHESSLILREESCNDKVWNVGVNGIEIGKVTDKKYASILREKLNDEFSAIRTLWAYASVAFQLLKGVLLTAPIAVFWFIAVAAIHSPESLQDLHQQFLQAPPSTISHFSSVLLITMTVLMLTLSAVAILPRELQRIDSQREAHRFLVLLLQFRSPNPNDVISVTEGRECSGHKPLQISEHYV